MRHISLLMRLHLHREQTKSQNQQRVDKKSVVNLLSGVCAVMLWRHFFIRSHTVYICPIVVYNMHLSLTSVKLSPKQGSVIR